MKGIWKMLTGEGEREYREQHRRFDDAIPNAPGFDERDHPAARSNSSDAMNYRRANACHGLKSKQEHKLFASKQRIQAREQETRQEERAGSWEWLFGGQ